MNKCIRMRISAFKIVIWIGISSVYSRKLRFTAPLTRRRKQNFRPYNADLPPQMAILNALSLNVFLRTEIYK